MKKNFFKKKLASALALALVVASVSPVSASAATAAKIVDKGTSTATAVLYVDKVSYGKSAVNFDLSKTYAGTTYTWTVSDSKKATIGAKTGYVVAKAPGVVKVTVTAKKGNKTTKFTQSVTIRKRATAVAAGDDFTLNSGETKSLKATLTPSTSTDAVKYVSDKETVATVDAKTGVVTAVGAGEATITVYAKAASSAPDTSKWNVTDTVKVTVALGVSSIKQTASTELAVTFNGKIESGKVAAGDFSIVNDVTKQVIAVKEAKADGTNVVKLTTFVPMTDGKSYTVTYNKKDTKFTATDGVVAAVSISPATIAYQTETEIKVSTADANGVVLNTYSYQNTSAEPKLEFTISDNKGYTNGKNLYLFNIGDTAKAKAVYHTWKYDTAGKEVGAITTELTITAVDKTAVGVSKQEYTIAKTLPNWNKFTANTQLAVGDTGMKLFLHVVKTNDKAAVKGDYTFESSNNNVLIATTDSTDLAAVLTPVTAGSAYVLVKDKDTVVWSLAVTVIDERKATALLLDTDNVTVSNAVVAGVAVDKKVVGTTLKDQYGKDLSFDPAKVTNPTWLSGSGTAPTLTMASDGKITVDPTGATVGTYQFKVLYNSIPRVLTVTVVAPDSSATAAYKLELTNSPIDTVFVDKNTGSKNFEAKVAIYKGGAIADYANITSYTIKKGSDVVASGTGLSVKSVTFAALTVNAGTKTVSKADAGSYVIELNYTGGTAPLAGGFNITDTQSAVTYTLVDTKVTGAGTVSAAIAKAFEFTYEGSKLDPVSIASYDAPTTAGTGVTYATVKSVTVNVTIDGYTVPLKVTINPTTSIQY